MDNPDLKFAVLCFPLFLFWSEKRFGVRTGWAAWPVAVAVIAYTAWKWHGFSDFGKFSTIFWIVACAVIPGMAMFRSVKRRFPSKYVIFLPLLSLTASFFALTAAKVLYFPKL